MKWLQKINIPVALLVIVVAIAVVNIVKVQAATMNYFNEYTLVYPEDDEIKAKIKKDVDSKGNEVGDGYGGMESTKIFSKRSGIAPGTLMFNFDRERSNKKDGYIYTREVYCDISQPGQASKISLEQPKSSLYAKFVLGIRINKGSLSGDQIFNQGNYKAVVGAYDGNPKQVLLNGSNISNLEAKDPFSSYGGMHQTLKAGNVDEASDVRAALGLQPSDTTEKVVINKRIKEQCMDVVAQSTRASNYQKLADDQKTAWKDALSAAGIGDPEEVATSAGVSADDDGSVGINCQGGPMGWLFCPMINYMTDALRTISSLIDSMMQIKFLAQTGSANSIETAWRAFLSIANIMLVIAFMVIVFSQATSAGLNNYNIKRMLPRLVIAAVLMNVSFYICALAIDISNIVGASIMGLFIGGGSVSDAIIGATGGADNSKGILGGALTGALIIGLLLFILTPVILSIIIVFVCLVARQLILICLILASPIAFVAWLLPNTEQYFKKWYSLFFQMLILYPAVMFIFGASLFFAKFLGGGGQGLDKADIGPDYEILRQITQLIVLCIPLVALPLLIKGSSNIMGKIGGYADKAGLKGISGAKGAGRLARKAPGVRAPFEAAGQWKDARATKLQRKKAGRAVRNAGVLSRVPGATGDIVGAKASSEKEKLFNEEVAMHEAKMLDSAPKDVRRLLDEAIASGNHHQARAAINRLSNMGVGGANELSDAIHEASPVSDDMAKTIQRGLNDSGNYGALIGKAADLSKGHFEENGAWSSGKVTDTSAQQLAGQSGDAMMRSAGISVTDTGKKDANGKAIDEFRDKSGAIISESEAIQQAAAHLQKDAGAKVSAISGNSDLEALVADDRSGAILAKAKAALGGGGGGGTPLPQPTQHGGGGPTTPPADIPAGYEKSDNSEIIIPRQR